MLKNVGLTNVNIDEVGNVVGVRRGVKSDGKFVVVPAHLDTVFPEGTDVKVKREGNRLLDEWIDVEKEPMVKAIATTLSIILVDHACRDGTGVNSNASH